MSDDAAARALLGMPQKELDKLPAELREKLEAARRQVLAAQRLYSARSARDSLLEFARMSMPSPDAPDDATKSRYKTHPIHEYLAAKLEAVQRGEILRLIISVQPRIGKSQLSTKSFPAWLMGKDPYNEIIVAGYGDDFVKEFGRDVRETMMAPFYRQVFPDTQLRRNAKAANRQQTTAGGIIHFAGLGGQLTGKGANYLIIDDPIKNADDARSKATKDSIWQGYTKDALSRLMGSHAAIVIVATRWAEDDLIGRLTDPKLGYVSEEDAAEWDYVNIPALIETQRDQEQDPFNREPGEVLWEERTPRKFLDSFRRLDPAGFAALYQGRPAPPEGDFFKRDQIQAYSPQDLPANLRFYGASDHAISLEQRRDSTCMGIAGVDEDDNIWILPELVWAQLDSENQVEAMIQLMEQYQPLAWWAEKGHISKSLGPFLRKRMLEEQVYVNVVEKTPATDKVTRAQAIQGRMSMGKVFLPRFAPWYADAVEQMLTFPNGAHDDFVDFIAWIGRGLANQLSASKPGPRKKKAPRTGSLDWILQESEQQRREKAEVEREARYLH